MRLPCKVETVELYHRTSVRSPWLSFVGKTHDATRAPFKKLLWVVASL